MIEREEGTSVVWETLMLLARPSTVQQIVSECGVHHLDVRKALSLLVDYRLVLRSGLSPKSIFTPVINLSSLQWAQALHIGIRLDQLEKHAAISEKEKKQANKMASDGVVEQQQTVKQNQKREEMARERVGRAAAMAATTDLARLVEDMEQALNHFKVPEASPRRKKKAHQALVHAHQEAKKALDGLTRSLIVADHAKGK